jgi:hypothetical protein
MDHAPRGARTRTRKAFDGEGVPKLQQIATLLAGFLQVRSTDAPPPNRYRQRRCHADDLFRARLTSMIDLRHPVAHLARRMPWAEL